MSDELKPCPFCGGEAEYYARTKNVPQFDEGVMDAMFVADCTVCNANIELEESQEAAISAWNIRASDNRIAELEGNLIALISIINKLDPSIKLDAAKQALKE